MSIKIDRDLCAQHLSGAVKFPTLSNDLEELVDFQPFHDLADYLEKTYPLVHSTLEHEVLGKAHLLYRWKGTGESGAKPILLMGHQDVVPEGDHSKWTYPPYSGHIDDEVVWGRGSADCKNSIIAQLEAVEHLIAEGFEPSYDIYLSFGYNEEVSGGNSKPSALLCAETLMERGVSVGVSLDEGGGMRSGKNSGSSVDLCAISVAEKGYADFEIYRLDPGGHSASPTKDGALDYVAKAILAIRDNQYPFRITDAVKRRYELLAPYMKESDPELSELLSDVEGNWDKLLPIIEDNNTMAAMFHTTMVATMAQGSDQANILPQKASVTVNCRLLEGDTLESVEAHLRSIIPEGMEIRLIKGSDPSPISEIDTDAAKLILKLCRERYGDDVLLLPDITTGGTDAKYMYGAVDSVYRFTGFYRKEGPSGTGVHNFNETMNIDALVRGTEFYIDFIKSYGK